MLRLLPDTSTCGPQCGIVCALGLFHFSLLLLWNTLLYTHFSRGPVQSSKHFTTRVSFIIVKRRSSEQSGRCTNTIIMSDTSSISSSSLSSSSSSSSDSSSSTVSWESISSEKLEQEVAIATATILGWKFLTNKAKRSKKGENNTRG
jgi:hypothetical protein